MYQQLVYAHLATVIPAVFLGSLLFLKSKGTDLHRTLGKIYMALMLLTAFITLFMPARLGPTLFNHFGFIHGFSILVIYSVPIAIFYVKRGNIIAHKSVMKGMFIGGIVIAGGFALMPGRYLNAVLFSG